MSDSPERPVPPQGPPPPEEPADPFEARRYRIYTRIGVIRKIIGSELNEGVHAVLDQLHAKTDAASHGDKDALNDVEDVLEELEDAMDSGALFD